MPATGVRNQGKTAFIKEFLIDHPTATTAAVNEAWVSAGMEGNVSPSLVNKMRSSLGLTGNIRKGRKPSATANKSKGHKAAGRPASAQKTEGTPAAEAARPEAPAHAGNRDRQLKDLESDLDRLIFKLMALGGLETVEDDLRKVRRRVVRSHNG